MKSIVIKENLKAEGQKFEDGVRLGFLAETPCRKLRREGYSLQSGELVGWFNGVRRFIEYVDRKDYGKVSRYYDSSHMHERAGGDWTKYSTYEEAEKVALNNPETFRDYTELDIRLKDWENSGNDVDYGMVGDFVDVGRYLSGEPECFGLMRNGNIIQQFCSIVINGNASCTTKADAIQERSKRILRLVDMLESNHIRCELSIVFSNDNSHLEIVIKNYNELLDIDDLAVATSPDFFRRFGFRFSEHSADTLEGSYGRSEKFNAEVFKDPDATTTIYFDGLQGDSKSSIADRCERFENLIANTGLEKDKVYQV